MKLIYRGSTYEYNKPVTNITYRKPRALNWRYQVPGEEYGDSSYDTTPRLAEMAYQKPRALNWRYQ
jgi:hypothetical protein